MKRTFKFDEEWKAAIGMLPQKMQQQLTEAIIRYQQTGEESKLPPVATALFMVIKCTVDRRAAVAARQRVAVGEPGRAPAMLGRQPACAHPSFPTGKISL